MSYDTIRFSVVQYPIGTFGLAVELLERGERGYYSEYRQEFPDYQRAYDHAKEKMLAFQKKLDSLELGITALCNSALKKSERPGEKLSRAQQRSVRARAVLSVTPAGLTAISIAKWLRQQKRTSRAFRLTKLPQFRGATIPGFSTR